MSFLAVENIWQAYGDRSILERVNVTFDEGEFISIVGASGCGKSTFLRLLLAQERPTRGKISIDGGEPALEPNQERGVVFQKYSVFPHLSVRENIIAGTGFSTRFGFLTGPAKRLARTRADEMLERIGLNHVADQYPASLSGGMQQRLAIGQAMAAKPRVLLLDEPFGALDPGTRLQMHDFLLELREETNMTVVMVTHDLDEAFKLGDRVLVFDKPRWDPHDPGRFGATITHDFDASAGGIPFQDILNSFPSLAEEASQGAK